MEIRRECRPVNCYPGANRPKYIVIHETDNYKKGAGAEAHAKAHAAGNLSTSVHWYVDDHLAVQTLNYDDGAWAVGKTYGTPPIQGVNNTNTINIEICVNPDSDYTAARKNCIELTRLIMQETGIDADHVIRHYDAKRKWCPRKMMDDPALWTDFLAAVAATKPEPEKKSGWHEEEGGWRYYHGDTGESIRNDWHEDQNGAWYWFDGAGHMVRNAWKQSADGHWYYLGADGCMVTDCLLGVGDEVYAFAVGGEMLEGEYIVRTNERGALELAREN